MKKLNNFWLGFLLSFTIFGTILSVNYATDINKNKATDSNMLDKLSIVAGAVEEIPHNETEKPTVKPVEKVETTQKSNTEVYTITAYCACKKCCGKTDGITASGVKATQGITIAADKSIPFGTKVYIEGVGERISQDRGGAIKGKRIDLYFDSHQEALNFGIQKRNVTILN